MSKDYETELFAQVNGYDIKYGLCWNGGYYEISRDGVAIVTQTGFSGSEKARVAAEKWIGIYKKEKENV